MLSFNSNSVKPGAAPAAPLPIMRGMHGDDVKEMQSKLADKGYLRKNEIDGAFGKITLGGLLAFQFENDLEVDRLCGPVTKKALGM